MRLLRALAVIAVTVTVCLGAAELAVRAIDRWPLWGRLALAEHAVDEATVRGADRPDRRHVPAVALAPGVAAEWYENDPPVTPRIPMTKEIADRANVGKFHRGAP